MDEKSVNPVIDFHDILSVLEAVPASFALDVVLKMAATFEQVEIKNFLLFTDLYFQGKIPEELFVMCVVDQFPDVSEGTIAAAKSARAAHGKQERQVLNNFDKVARESRIDGSTRWWW